MGRRPCATTAPAVPPLPPVLPLLPAFYGFTDTPAPNARNVVRGLAGLPEDGVPGFKA